MRCRVLLCGLISISLSVGLCIHTTAAQEPEGQVIVVSPRVGEMIDFEERERFKLFPTIHTFHSAQFRLLPDSTLVARVTLIEHGITHLQYIRLPKSMLQTIGETIEHFEEIQAGTYRMTSISGQPAPSQRPPPRRSGAGRVTAQVAVGALVGGLTGVVAFVGTYEGDPATTLGLMYGLNALISSVTVYGIGKGFDNAAHGSYGVTLGGALIGAAVGSGLLIQANHSDNFIGEGLFTLSPIECLWSRCDFEIEK